MQDVHRPLKVLSVVGAGRSGTTILASILGEIDGFASAGELRWLWERAVRDQKPCGCERVATECPVWSPVISRTLALLASEVPPRTLEDLIRAQHELRSRRSVARTIRGVGAGASDWESLELVREATRSAVEAFAEVTDSPVVVDTSKRPLDAAVLAGMDDISHYVLHIVRDPRAVVHSWRRKKTFTAEGRTREMGTRGLASTVRRWSENSVSAEHLRRKLPSSRWMYMAYEDFAAEPRAWVDRIVSFVGEDGRGPFLDERTVLLNPNHIVVGNPSRFTTGRVTIRTDDEWRRSMPRRDQMIVNLLTLPVRARFRLPRHSQA